MPWSQSPVCMTRANEGDVIRQGASAASPRHLLPICWVLRHAQRVCISVQNKLSCGARTRGAADAAGARAADGARRVQGAARRGGREGRRRGQPAQADHPTPAPQLPARPRLARAARAATRAPGQQQIYNTRARASWRSMVPALARMVAAQSACRIDWHCCWTPRGPRSRRRGADRAGTARRATWCARWCRTCALARPGAAWCPRSRARLHCTARRRPAPGR